MENQKKAFNKNSKITISTFIGVIFFALMDIYVISSNILWDITLFPLKSWGGWTLAEIISPVLFYTAVVLLVLTPIFGVIASFQTHKRDERGGVIALLLAGISILYIISQFLI